VRPPTFGFSGTQGTDLASLRLEGRRTAVKRLLLTASLFATLSFGMPATLLADPGGPNLQQPINLTCDNGMRLTVNPGTLTNRGRVAWDVNRTGVF
jgi:hypothetical protein